MRSEVNVWPQLYYLNRSSSLACAGALQSGSSEVCDVSPVDAERLPGLLLFGHADGAGRVVGRASQA